MGPLAEPRRISSSLAGPRQAIRLRTRLAIVPPDSLTRADRMARSTSIGATFLLAAQKGPPLHHPPSAKAHNSTLDLAPACSALALALALALSHLDAAIAPAASSCPAIFCCHGIVSCKVKRRDFHRLICIFGSRRDLCQTSLGVQSDRVAKRVCGPRADRVICIRAPIPPGHPQSWPRGLLA